MLAAYGGLFFLTVSAIGPQTPTERSGEGIPVKLPLCAYRSLSMAEHTVIPERKVRRYTVGFKTIPIKLYGLQSTMEATMLAALGEEE